MVGKMVNNVTQLVSYNEGVGCDYLHQLEFNFGSTRNEVGIHDNFESCIPLRYKSHVNLTFNNLEEENDFPAPLLGPLDEPSISKDVTVDVPVFPEAPTHLTQS